FMFEYVSDSNSFRLVDLLSNLEIMFEAEQLRSHEFSITNAIVRNQEWREEVVFADRIQRRQVAQLIQDSFVEYYVGERMITLSSGLTLRERFDVRPVGQRKGYIVIDKLKDY